MRFLDALLTVLIVLAVFYSVSFAVSGIYSLFLNKKED